MTQKIKIAVVGAGHLGRFHARLLAKHPDYDLKAVVDPSVTARESVAQEVSVRNYDSCETLLTHEELQAAVIASPTKYHFTLAESLIQAGKHLLIEKPLASDLSQAEALVAAASEKKCVLQVGHIERFNPALSKVYREVTQPTYIDAKRMGGYSFRSTDIGVVFDLMIHDVDVVLSILKSKPTNIEAVGVCVMGPQEDIATARMRFEGGCIVNLTASRVSEVVERKMHIWDQQCFVEVDYAAGHTRWTRPADAMKLQQHKNAEQLSWEEKREAQGRFFDEWLKTEQVNVESRNALEDELTDFARAINTGTPPQVDGAAGRDAVAVCEQILENMTQVRWQSATSNADQPVVSPSTTAFLPRLEAAEHRRAS